MKKGFLKELLRRNQTVYSFKTLVLLWPNTKPSTIKSRINYYVKKGELYHIRRGLYAKDKNYERFELATKLYTPAYISFESVLVWAGIVFQHYKQIFVATYQSKNLVCDGQDFVFKKIKSTILIDAIGVDIKENYSIASPERALLDTLYINKYYYFDNLGPINWDKVFEILPIYKNKRMTKEVYRIYKLIKQERSGTGSGTT